MLELSFWAILRGKKATSLRSEVRRNHWLLLENLFMGGKKKTPLRTKLRETHWLLLENLFVRGKKKTPLRTKLREKINPRGRGGKSTNVTNKWRIGSKPL